MTGRGQSTEPGEPPKENTLDLLRLFVYGTLKRGYWNHEPFCEGVLEIREARIRGRLYDGPGFPLLEVPDEDILAHGTADPLADVATQARLSDRVESFPHSPKPSSTTPQWAPGAPCTGSCSPSTTPNPAYRPSTAWRGSGRAAPASTGVCWYRPR